MSSNSFIPAGWPDVFARTIMVGLAALIALNVKEWVDSQKLDPGPTATDAIWVAGVALLLNAILHFLAPKRRLD